MEKTPPRSEPPANAIGCWTVGGIWILVSLTAIALIGETPYLGLFVAVLGGIAVGLASYLYYQGTQLPKNSPLPTAQSPENDSEQSDI